MLRIQTHHAAECSARTKQNSCRYVLRIFLDLRVSTPQTFSLVRHSRAFRCCAQQSSNSPQNTEAQTYTKTELANKGLYAYESDSGIIQKATMEHVLSTQATTDNKTASSTPTWSLGWQMNEQNLVWHDALKAALIKRIATDELGIAEEEMEGRLQQLANLLPDLKDRFALAPPKMLARLAGSTHLLAARLLRLRTILPEADISCLTAGRLSLLLDEDLDEVEAAVLKLRQLLPNIKVDRFVEAFPIVLNLESFELALVDARRNLPSMDIERQLRTDPEIVLGFMKGRSLIPYDA